MQHAISTLLRRAQHEPWLISPFISLGDLGWLERAISEALERNVSVHLIVRDDGPSKTRGIELDAEELVAKGLSLQCVPSLHAKVYWTDQSAVVTSLNLLASSMNNSIEVGLQVGPSPMHLELKRFIEEKVVRYAGEMPLQRRERERREEQAKREAQEAQRVKERDERLAREKAELDLRKAAREAAKPLTRPRPGVPPSEDREGHCIRCGMGLAFDPEKPLCSQCYRIWNRYGDPDYPEKVCHACGSEARSSMGKPLCYDCYRQFSQADAV